MKGLALVVIMCFIGFAANAQIEENLINDAQVFLDEYTVEEAINYRLLKDNKSDLERLIRRVESSLPPTDEEALAFYCLAYNLHTIDKILQSYPIQSVKQDAYFFTDDVTIAGRQISLNTLEKELITNYDHGAIHFLLVCGAKSCPSLPNHLYIKDNKAYLDSIYFSILEQGKFAYIDRYNEEIVFSKIFQWYSNDFGGEAKIIEQLAFNTRQNLSEYSIRYDDYDWTLNDILNEVQTRFIPTRLLTKGQVETKIFSNYYTQSEPGATTGNVRSSFWSNIITMAFGSNKNYNIGLFARIRSVSVFPADGIGSYLGALHVQNQNLSPLFGISTYKRFGLTALGPQVKYRPNINNRGNNIFVHTLTFATGQELQGNNLEGYIDWDGISLFNQWYYDYDIDIKNNLFYDIGLNIENVNKALFNGNGGFAYLSTPITVIYSRYPIPGVTLYALGNATPRISISNNGSSEIKFDPFGQIGGGIKYFLSDLVEVEFLLTQFFGGSIQRNAQTINFGLRYTY